MAALIKMLEMLLGVGLLNHYIQSGRRNSDIASAAIKLCINLKMQTPRVCSGIVGSYVVSKIQFKMDQGKQQRPRLYIRSLVFRP